MVNEIHRRLSRIPLFAGRPASAFSIEPMGGLTNTNHKVTLDGQSYVLRIAGRGIGETIDRRAEETNIAIIAPTGINAEVLFMDPSDGLQLTRFVNDARTLEIGDFEDLETVCRAARLLRRVHAVAQPFATAFDVFAMIDGYLERLLAIRGRIPAGFADIAEEVEAVRRVFAANPAVLVPCHCDPLPDNFLVSGRAMYLIDWEYAGNNDPMWDLGDLAVEAEFDARRDGVLLAAYFDGEAAAGQAGRMAIYKALSDLLWSLWADIQVAEGNSVAQFQAYGKARLERCKAAMAAGRFAEHLKAVGDG